MGVPSKYRMSKDPSKSCQTCAYYNPIMSACNKFVTYVDKNAVCDAWSMGTKMAAAIVKRAVEASPGAMQQMTFAATQAPVSTQQPPTPPSDDSQAKTQKAEASNDAENARLNSQNTSTSTQRSFKPLPLPSPGPAYRAMKSSFRV